MADVPEALIAEIRQAEVALLKAITNAYEAARTPPKGEAARCRSLSRSNLEQSVMWALRGLGASS